MTAFDKVKESYYDGLEDSLNKKTLALAYLELHLDNPGLHPDDYLDPECNYGGWHALLVHRIWTTWSSLPDSFRYPSSLYRFQVSAYLRLTEFHLDDEDRTFIDKLERVYIWMCDMTVLNLHAVCQDLTELTAFHDGAPEEISCVLAELLKVLNWVDALDN